MNIHNIQINGETIINATPNMIAQILVNSFELADLLDIAYKLGSLKAVPKSETKTVINITSEPQPNIPEVIQKMADANGISKEEVIEQIFDDYIPVGKISIINGVYSKWDGEDWEPINHNTPDVTYIHTAGNHELAAYVNTYCRAEPEFNMMWTAITAKADEKNVILELIKQEIGIYTLKFGEFLYSGLILFSLVEFAYNRHCK